MFVNKWQKLFSPEDQGGGGGGDQQQQQQADKGGGGDQQQQQQADKGGGGDQQQQADKGGDQQQQQQVSAYRPEGLPDHLYGASEKETLDKVWGAYKGARDAIGALGEVPKSPDDYKFEWSEKVKPYEANLKDDKFLGKVRGIAHELKIPTKQFATLLDRVMSEMIAGDMVAEPFDATREIAALVPDVKDPAERMKQADAMSREAIARVEAWKEQDMPEDAATFLLSMMDRAPAIKLANWIADRAGEARPALNGHQAGGVTESQLDQMMDDPRGELGNAKYDPAFVKSRDEAFQRFYGTGQGRR
jgi:hypothetical protein